MDSADGPHSADSVTQQCRRVAALESRDILFKQLGHSLQTTGLPEGVQAMRLLLLRPMLTCPTSIIPQTLRA